MGKWHFRGWKTSISHGHNKLITAWNCTNAKPFSSIIMGAGGEDNFILSGIYNTCTYNRQTPELKYVTWAWQGQKLHNK